MKDTVSLNFKPGYKHFSMLRKAIVLKKSGLIRYHTANDCYGELFIESGAIDCSDNYQQLIQFLSSAMLITEWHDSALKLNTMPAIKAVKYAIDHVSWSEPDLHMISVMFSKLPQVRVSLIDIHFDSFLTDISYNLFYQQSLSIEGFTPAQFLLISDSSNSLLLHRVRVLTFNYLLGMMRQIKTKNKTIVPITTNKNKRLGFVKRIVNRIRGL